VSYDNMDHVGWVESNIAAHKRRKPPAADRRHADQGRGWWGAPDVLNPFQRQVVIIVGIIGRGIYNASINWTTVEWRHPDIISLTWRGELATHDGSELTDLILLAHEARIRVSVSPAGRYLRLDFHHREAAGILGSRHPDLAARIVQFAARFDDDHPVMYRHRRIAEWGDDRAIWPAGMFGWRYFLRRRHARLALPIASDAMATTRRSDRDCWPAMRDRSLF